MRGRHLTTAVTMLILLAILAAGAVVGLRSLFAPLPRGQATAKATPACVTKSVKKGQRVSATQVEVSVFNAGSRAGLADETMLTLVQRGFRKGKVGNAPAGSTVKKAQVWTTQKHDPAARLVARQFGKAVKVRSVKVDLGPGVDVVVGDGFTKLVKAKRVIIVKRTSSACLPSAGGSLTP